MRFYQSGLCFSMSSTIAKLDRPTHRKKPLPNTSTTLNEQRCNVPGLIGASPQHAKLATICLQSMFEGTEKLGNQQTSITERHLPTDNPNS